MDEKIEQEIYAYSEKEVLVAIDRARDDLRGDLKNWRERLNEPGNGQSWNIIHNLYRDIEGINMLVNVPEFAFKALRTGEYDLALLVEEVATLKVAQLAYDSYDEAWEEVLENI